MERGIYFDGWFKNNHCYHPSMPLRSLQMLEDLEKYHATLLVWAGMGGGSISLPWLEHEAFGPVDPRMRFYGYMNDSEFVEACNRRGIKLFGIVFEVQGWEFPAVIDPEGNRIERINLHAEAAPDHGWYGLREFSQDKYPGLFGKSLKDYYPDGIVNSDGEPVTDLWEECAARKLDGSAVHAQWVEVKGHAQQAHQMCRNNPVWRDYLKKIMQIMIDAGVPGIQLDECELPITAIGSGGCFCKDCMKQFTAWLKAERREGRLGPEFDDIDLDAFNYRDYLNARGCTFPNGAPLYRYYWEFQMRAVKKYFSELVDWAKAYAREKWDRDVLVSGNMFNLMPVYYPIVDKVDVIITEMQHTLFRQPHFYRYCAGFAGDKPVIVAENPYGGIVPRMLELLNDGRGFDLYRIFLLEASVYGCNMAVPYGGWMGNTIKDSFWAPRGVTAQVQDFLAGHERFFARSGRGDAAVLYSFPSNYWRETSKGNGGNAMLIDEQESLLDCTTSEWNDPGTVAVPFWSVIKRLSDAQVMYDVKMLGGMDVCEDRLTDADLEGYGALIVPDCFDMTENQLAVLKRRAEKGCRVYVCGRLAENHPEAARALLDAENVYHCAEGDGDAGGIETLIRRYLRERAGALSCSDPQLGLQRFEDDDYVYLHVLNYRYDAAADAIQPVENVTFFVPGVRGFPELYTLDGRIPAFHMQAAEGGQRVTVERVPLYMVIALAK